MIDTPSRVRPTRVFVLDDYDLIRRGLEDLLAATDDLAVVGEAARASEAMPEIERVRPDVAIFDVVLPDGSGVDVCREVRTRHPHIKCLLMTFHDDEEALLATVMSGALGYLTKQIHGSQLVAGIRQVAGGHTLTDLCEGRQLLERVCHLPQRGRPHSSVGDGLSERERHILDRVSAGATNTEIAAELALTEQVAGRQVSIIFAKLSLARRVHAATYGAPLPPARS